MLPKIYSNFLNFSSGSESHLSECPRSKINENCSAAEAAWVVCSKFNTNSPRLKLSHGREGIIHAYDERKNKWSLVCTVHLSVKY